MSPEGTPAPNTEPVGIMDYARIMEFAVRTEKPANLQVIRQELLRRSAEPGVKEDPEYQRAWALVEERMMALANES